MSYLVFRKSLQTTNKCELLRRLSSGRDNLPVGRTTLCLSWAAHQVSKEHEKSHEIKKKKALKKILTWWRRYFAVYPGASVWNSHVVKESIKIDHNQHLLTMVYLLATLLFSTFSFWRAACNNNYKDSTTATTHCSCFKYFTFLSFCILSCCRFTSLTCSSAIALSFERKTQCHLTHLISSYKA